MADNGDLFEDMTEDEVDRQLQDDEDNSYNRGKEDERGSTFTAIPRQPKLVMARGETQLPSCLQRK